MGKHIFYVSTESKKWWSFLWEDVEAASRSKSCSNHPGDDKKEGKKQERVAAFNTGNYGKEVMFIENVLQKAVETTLYLDCCKYLNSGRSLK